MGSGPNFVLDKGHIATGATAYARGEIVTPGAFSNGQPSVSRATTVSATNLLYVCMEDLDATRLAAGKAAINCRVLGIARVIAGGAITQFDRVKNDTTARAATVTRAIAGAQPVAILGIALTAATAAGQEIDVLLIPGGSF